MGCHFIVFFPALFLFSGSWCLYVSFLQHGRVFHFHRNEWLLFCIKIMAIKFHINRNETKFIRQCLDWTLSKFKFVPFFFSENQQKRCVDPIASRSEFMLREQQRSVFFFKANYNSYIVFPLLSVCRCRSYFNVNHYCIHCRFWMRRNDFT